MIDVENGRLQELEMGQHLVAPARGGGLWGTLLCFATVSCVLSVPMISVWT